MGYSVEIDRKWQAIWAKQPSNQFNWSDLDAKEKLYILEMFSYPSGAKLHVGHWYNYSLSDSYARMKQMQGYAVFQPMGFDAFGLPAENYAIKTGIHPMDSTYENIRTMEQQLREMGGQFAWNHELATCHPGYYKWTQWLFLQLYKKGLAYRKKAPVNWCPSCHTVLANEQVVNDGHCERCGTEVTRKNLTQWFFKITEYAQELLDGHAELNWPEKTIKIQQNWIGRSEGNEIIFYGEKEGKMLQTPAGDPLPLTVFTTRADTLMGVSYLVVAPESDLCAQLTTPEHETAMAAYVAQTRKASDIDRMASNREKTGVFTGSYAIHPITQEKLPIWASDYVIAGYGTGVVMGVPAHDERDYAYAQAFNLPIKPVIRPQDESVEQRLPYCEKGVLYHSGAYDGLTSADAAQAIMSDLGAKKLGKPCIHYRLKDWLVSRQRYWGAPIPIIHCEHCGVVPVPEDQLPVELPYDVAFEPDGKSPLAKSEAYMQTTCPCCGRPARRDPDTLDTFVCSSWYYLRYIDPRNDSAPFDPKKIAKLAPVDVYIGGAEHAAMHLLYARFITKALRDMGYLHFDEPFKRLIHQGVILGSDGFKMSKSKGNTVSPDTYIEAYGSDVFRLYLAFGFAYTEGGPWNDNGVKSIDKLLQRMARLGQVIIDRQAPFETDDVTPKTEAEKTLNRARHFAIKGVTQDAERFQFNTSVARIMELVNALYAYINETSEDTFNPHLFTDVIKDLYLITAPFAPHYMSELWEKIGGGQAIFQTAWPTYSEAELQQDTVEIAVQINGKLITKMHVATDLTPDTAKPEILKHPTIQERIADREISKFIFVPKRLANIVVK